MVEKVIMVRPRGFCAGVERAVRAVEEALEIFGAPVYVKHQIVHNARVVRDLEAKGAVTIEDVRSVPDGAPVVFSAHGSPPEHFRSARDRGLKLIDATCPLVTKVHLEVHRFLKGGFDIVYIGHKGHVEGLGVRAEAKLYGRDIPIVESIHDVETLECTSEKLSYLTQTTLSIEETTSVIGALKKKYPHIVAPPIQDICYATTNRQEAIKQLARQADAVLVVGSKNSSNSNRLVETARAEGTEAYLVDGADDIQKMWFRGKHVVGISAGASAPESAVEEVAAFFTIEGAEREDFRAVVEDMHFSMPMELDKYRNS